MCVTNTGMCLQVEEELSALGLDKAAIEGILAATRITSLEGLEELLGAQDPAVTELRELFNLAEAAGFADYLEFDPSVVRGLAYYTGAAFVPSHVSHTVTCHPRCRPLVPNRRVNLSPASSHIKCESPCETSLSSLIVADACCPMCCRHRV